PASAVDQHVDAAQPIEHETNRAMHGCPVAVVGRNQLTRSPSLLDQTECLTSRIAGGMIVDGDPGAFARQPERAGTPEPPARAGHASDSPDKPSRGFHAGFSPQFAQ